MNTWKWYEWGDEQPGYVSIWRAGKNGEVIHGRNITRAEAWRRNYEFECPFN